MSDRVRALVWDYYDEKRFGAPRILAIALSDEADDRGGGIFQSVVELARKTEQNRRTVQRQLRMLMDSKLLERQETSNGGPGQFHHFRLNLALLVTGENSGTAPPLTAAECRSSDPTNSGVAPPLGPTSVYKESKDLLDGDVNAAVTDDTEDRRLGDWIFDRIKLLNPRHRQPVWKTWCKDLRLMRKSDGHTRREIADLFAFANKHHFWQANVLSPSALRRQWDRLVIERNRMGTVIPAAAASSVCSIADCKLPPAFRTADGRNLCRAHQETEERERARIQA